jgi:putative FmdB family regulatory protein
MVLYEFECQNCGHILEKYVAMGTKKSKCPECGNYMKKIISLSSFILKGSGWEKDGYGSIPSNKLKNDN